MQHNPGDGKVAPEITLQAEVGGFQIAIVDHMISATPAELDARLDIYRKAIERQRAHNSLVEALVDLTACSEALESWDDRRAEALALIAAEQARTRASFEAKNQVGRRRSEELTPAQNEALAEYPDRQKAEQARLDAEKATLKARLPMYETQVARQRAIIAGRDRSEVIAAAAPVAEAAD